MEINTAATTCVGSAMLSVLIMLLAVNITRLASWAVSIYKSRWGA
jgi:hypothetical protein